MTSGGAKREQILDGASRAFAGYGFRKTTIGDIVREAGVARATVYKYFETKEDVFDGVLRREAEELLAAVAEAAGTAGATREKLRAAIITHTDLIRKKLNILRVMVEAEVAMRRHCSGGMQDLQARAVGLYEEILSEGMANGEIAVDDVGASARALLLLFKGLFVATLTEMVGAERDAIVDRMLDMIMDGLRPREDEA